MSTDWTVYDDDLRRPLSAWMLDALQEIERSKRYGLGTLDEPAFAAASKVHDWRNHVPDALIKDWSNLSHETRLALLFVALQLADQEIWD